MAPVFIPEIISVFLTIGVVGGATFLVIWGIRKANRSYSSRKLRRKLATGEMASGDK